jgi:type II secretory pathway component PulM
MKVTAREKRFLLVGGAILAIALTVYAVVSLVPSRATLAAEVAAKKRTLLAQRELLSQEEIFKTRVEQYRKRLEQDRTRLLPGDNPNVAGAELQKVLKDFGDKNGVEILRKDIQREQKVQDNLIKVSVHIETNCLPDQLVQFLAAIENYDKFLTLDELTINSFKMQKRYEIRPALTVSGYIAGPDAKPAEKPAGAP